MTAILKRRDRGDQAGRANRAEPDRHAAARGQCQVWRLIYVWNLDMAEKIRRTLDGVLDAEHISGGTNEPGETPVTGAAAPRRRCRSLQIKAGCLSAAAWRESRSVGQPSSPGFRGSILHADPPAQGVKFARRNTIYVTWLPGHLEMQRLISIPKTGFVASVPFLFRLVGSIGGGWLTDLLTKRDSRGDGAGNVRGSGDGEQLHRGRRPYQ
jgi:hypothetical protein